jgi:class 3 adenylate cyclase
MVETARVQYVFLDVVGFTRNGSVEAQSEVVATLNDVVIRALQTVDIPAERVVLLPTGDGMALTMIEVSGFDAHLQLALCILRVIAGHNSGAADAMRRVEVRIGINENVDSVLPDINGRRNVAGSGISIAQRIMDKADAGQVLVGQSVYEVLRQREN